MSSVMRENGYLVVMVDWTNGRMIPIAGGVPSQEDAEKIAADVKLTDADAVVYVMPTTAYAR